MTSTYPTAKPSRVVAKAAGCAYWMASEQVGSTVLKLATGCPSKSEATSRYLQVLSIFSSAFEFPLAEIVMSAYDPVAGSR
jgi:hypothetical protein